MDAELPQLIQRPRLAEIRRERWSGALVKEILEFTANLGRRTWSPIADLISQPAYKATLELGTEAEKPGIPFPAGIGDRDIVQLVAKVESHLEVVVTQLVASGDWWRRAERSRSHLECRDHEVAERPPGCRKSHAVWRSLRSAERLALGAPIGCHPSRPCRGSSGTTIDPKSTRLNSRHLG